MCNLYFAAGPSNLPSEQSTQEAEPTVYINIRKRQCPLEGTERFSDLSEEEKEAEIRGRRAAIVQEYLAVTGSDNSLQNLLDLCALVAEQRSKDHGVSKDRFWIAKQTQRNLQELCACCAIQVTSVNGPDAPWSSTELKLEQHFGHLRGQFANSQLRTRDYLHASAKKSYQTLLKMQHQSPTLQENLPKRVEKPLSDETFIACSERALNSALRLMAACSEFLGLSFTIGSIGMF